MEAVNLFAEQNGLKIAVSEEELMNIATKVATGEMDDVATIGATILK